MNALKKILVGIILLPWMVIPSQLNNPSKYDEKENCAFATYVAPKHLDEKTRRLNIGMALYDSAIKYCLENTDAEEYLEKMDRLNNLCDYAFLSPGAVIKFPICAGKGAK
jgi:hypothetical protein